MIGQSGFGGPSDEVFIGFTAELTRGASIAHGKGGGEILAGREAAGHGDIGNAGSGRIAHQFGGVFEAAMIEKAQG